MTVGPLRKEIPARKTKGPSKAQSTETAKSALLLRKHVPALDGLRALAVFAVFLFHLEDLMSSLPSLRWLSLRGWIGVDVFFTLSGFLITWLLLRERLGNGRIAVRQFYARRVLRLLPAYLVVVAGSTVTLLVAGSAVQRVQAVAALPYLLTYTTNFAAASGVVFPLTLHAWSLAVEQQYYLGFPILVRLLTTRTLAVTLAALVVTISVVRAIGFFFWPLPWPSGGQLTTVVYYFTPLRIDSILVGALAATLLAFPQALARIRSTVLVRWRLGILWLMWIFIAVMFARHDWRWLYIVWLPLFNTLSALLILMIYLGYPTTLCRYLAWKPLVSIGRISYGMYLLHVICIVLLSRAVTELKPDLAYGPGLVALGSFLATLLASKLMYRYVETPFLRIKTRLRMLPRASADFAEAESHDSNQEVVRLDRAR